MKNSNGQGRRQPWPRRSGWGLTTKTGRSAGPPAPVLFCLAPMTAELLTGSAPPAEFFNPFLLLVLTALYGSGAILVRELALRWHKGWPSILVLGAAYGIVEEGLMVKSFFDSALGRPGRGRCLRPMGRGQLGAGASASRCSMPCGASACRSCW